MRDLPQGSLKRHYYSWPTFFCGLLCLFLLACSSLRKPDTFVTPNAALAALKQAVATRSVEQADALFGSEGDYFLHTGDEVLDQKRARRFVELFEANHQLIKEGHDTYVLTIGKKSWPFPIPLVRGSGGWYFDATAGKEEIATRIVGENELSALEVSRATVVAQKSYAASDRDGDGQREYATRIISTPGSRDGLYWPTDEFEQPSPMGPFIAQAADEDYAISTSGQPVPYRGYYFRIMPSEKSEFSPDDALSNPGRYWLIAFPAQRGISGVMAFATNERGWIFEKDLGRDTTMKDLSSINIDRSWTRIE